MVKKNLEKKELCKLCKDDYLKENLTGYIELVKEAKYVCKKCGRAAKKEKSLCKAEKL